MPNLGSCSDDSDEGELADEEVYHSNHKSFPSTWTSTTKSMVDVDTLSRTGTPLFGSELNGRTYSLGFMPDLSFEISILEED